MDDLIEDATEDVEVMALIGRLTVEKERLENRIHKLQKRLVYQDGYSFLDIGVKLERIYQAMKREIENPELENREAVQIAKSLVGKHLDELWRVVKYLRQQRED